MFIRATEHFRGTFPVDVGGITLAGFGQKPVDEKLGAYICKVNFPFVVECDKDGKYLVAVPEVKVLTFTDPSFLEPVVPKVSLPPSTTGTSTADAVNAGVQGEEARQPDIQSLTPEELDRLTRPDAAPRVANGLLNADPRQLDQLSRPDATLKAVKEARDNQPRQMDQPPLSPEQIDKVNYGSKIPEVADSYLSTDEDVVAAQKLVGLQPSNSYPPSAQEVANKLAGAEIAAAEKAKKKGK